MGVRLDHLSVVIRRPGKGHALKGGKLAGSVGRVESLLVAARSNRERRQLCTSVPLEASNQILDLAAARLSNPSSECHARRRPQSRGGRSDLQGYLARQIVGRVNAMHRVLGRRSADDHRFRPGKTGVRRSDALTEGGQGVLNARGGDRWEGGSARRTLDGRPCVWTSTERRHARGGRLLLPSSEKGLVKQVRIE